MGNDSLSREYSGFSFGQLLILEHRTNIKNKVESAGRLYEKMNFPAVLDVLPSVIEMSRK